MYRHRSSHKPGSYWIVLLLVASLASCGGRVWFDDAGPEAGPDQNTADLSQHDQASDQARADLAAPDRPRPDLPHPDLPHPDLLQPDLPQADLPQPDMAAPDQSLPKPDTQVPVVLVDDTFSDFKQGTLSESGAKIYASAKGNVQLLDRWDLNNDGYLDLVFSGSVHPTKPSVITNSLVYWGSLTGVTNSNKTVLESIAGQASTPADLDADGHVDIVIPQYTDDTLNPQINSFVYWGSSSGFQTSKRSQLPTVGGSSAEVADLNRDGYLDVVIGNLKPKPPSTQANAYIYWGSSTGYSSKKRTELPTVKGSTIGAIADLNNSGYLDLVFRTTKAYIYWGGAQNYSSTNQLVLDTISGGETSVADLDNDGFLDLIMPNYQDPKTKGPANSYIYWGGKSGYSNGARLELPTMYSHTVAVADLNNDQHLDIVFGNRTNGKDQYILNSYIYWGSGTKAFSQSNKTEFRTHGATGVLVLDLNGDTFPELISANYRMYKKTTTDSFVYWGAKSGYSSVRTGLQTYGTNGNWPEAGSVYNRKPMQTFTSRALDAATATSCTQLKVTAKVPLKTQLRFQVRSAASAAGLAKASWYGPTSTTDYYEQPNAGISNPTVNSTKIFTLNKAHAGQRYLQYRATLSHDFGNTPVLDRVELVCQ